MQFLRKTRRRDRIILTDIRSLQRSISQTSAPLRQINPQVRAPKVLPFYETVKEPCPLTVEEILALRRHKLHIPCFPTSGKASSFRCDSYQNQSVCFDFVRKNGGADTAPSRLSATAAWSKPILTTCRRKIDWIPFAASEPRTLRDFFDKLKKEGPEVLPFIILSYLFYCD